LFGPLSLDLLPECIELLPNCLNLLHKFFPDNRDQRRKMLLFDLIDYLIDDTTLTILTLIPKIQVIMLRFIRLSEVFWVELKRSMQIRLMRFQVRTTITMMQQFMTTPRPTFHQSKRCMASLRQLISMHAKVVVLIGPKLILPLALLTRIVDKRSLERVERRFV
jgi:hypothetical protein